MALADWVVIAVVVAAVFGTFYRHGHHCDIAERRRAEAKSSA